MTTTDLLLLLHLTRTISNLVYNYLIIFKWSLSHTCLSHFTGHVLFITLNISARFRHQFLMSLLPPLAILVNFRHLKKLAIFRFVFVTFYINFNLFLNLFCMWPTDNLKRNYNLLFPQIILFITITFKKDFLEKAQFQQSGVLC